MTEGGPDFAALIRGRLDQASVAATAAVVEAASRYLAVLQQWNRKINLTAFDLDRPTDQSIDRLIVEPIAAAAELRRADRVLVDVGSGGGSPALVLKIAAPHLGLVMIEARTKKAAFLRAAGRELGLGGVEVATTRLGAEADAPLCGIADVVSIRAVRGDEALWRGVRSLLAPTGRVLWFVDDGGRVSGRTSLPGWVARPPVTMAAARYVRVLEPA